MRLRVGVVVVVLFGLLAAGLLVTWIADRRVDAGRATCQNNMRELSLFAIAATGGRPDGKPVFASEKEKAARPKLAQKELDRLSNLGLPPAVPAGTVPNPALPPNHRLSWGVTLIPSLDQRRQDTSGLLASIDKTQAWDADTNRPAARTVVRGLLCPGNPIEVAPGTPAVTQYVGAGGVGADAATLPATAPTAGCFRYDAPTPLDAIIDGLSQTVLFAEVSAETGPWLRGGSATVRSLDPAKPVIGPGNQFGGNHPEGAIFGMADGSNRLLTPRTDPAVLAVLFTINGGPGPLPGD